MRRFCRNKRQRRRKDNQIQALVHPDKQKDLQQGMTPNNPLRIAPQPTYAKISRTYLDVETLHYYDIPYEYDVVSTPIYTCCMLMY
jgi:hypothetical protein